MNHLLQVDVEIDAGSLTLAYGGSRIRIAPMDVIILKQVLREEGSSYEEIMDVINSGRKDGGTSYKSLGVRLYNLRKILLPLGLVITRINPRCGSGHAGSAKGRYQLRVREHVSTFKGARQCTF